MFDANYDERMMLRDGREVRFRAIRPDDRARMVEGLRRLSPESRYLRFFTDKRELSESELRYLTEPDGVDHYAIVVAVLEGDDEIDGAGVARFVAYPDRPRVAEPAILVADEYQRLGLGRMLMDRLMAAAAERGIRSFRSEVLARNAPMLTMLKDIAPDAMNSREGTVIVCEFPLGDEAERPRTLPPGPPPPEDEEPETEEWRQPFDLLLRAIAEGRAEIARRVALTEQWLGERIFGSIARDEAEGRVALAGTRVRREGSDSARAEADPEADADASSDDERRSNDR